MIGRALIGMGLLLVLAGLLFLLAERLGLPFGRLPGDLSFSGRSWRVYLPLGTSIVLSLLLTLLASLFFRRK